MTSLAAAFENPRRAAIRWSVCFAVVIAAHGAAVLALLRNAPSDSDFDAGAPVVTIELPEAPAAFATPPTELAPGPTEPETEQAPPPKEETKPPEEVAEVALPEPEPPKPEPPAEEKPPTAMPSVAMVPTMPAPPVAGAAVQPSDAAVRRRWESGLVAHIERYKRYPAAVARGQRGSALVEFRIDRDGRLQGSRIVESSGSPEIDRDSLAALDRAQPMPKPPGQVEDSALSFKIRFNMWRADSR
jgi:periplasmic protein TonB